MNGKVEPRHKILLDAQLPNVERVVYILGMHEQQDFAVHWNGHLARNDVVPRFHVVRRIQSKIVSIGLVNLIGMKCAKLSVRPGIPEIESKLARLSLNWQGRRLRRRKVDVGPCLLTQCAERQNFCANQNESGGHHQLRATRYLSDL